MMTAPKNHEFHNVLHCARCGQDHEALEFHFFVGAPIEDPDGTIWNRWGLCPITGDPVLLRSLTQEEDGK
jgi:hypothetical protein